MNGRYKNLKPLFVALLVIPIAWANTASLHAQCQWDCESTGFGAHGCDGASACCGQDDFWTRSQLTGDWGGTRTWLAESGITFDADATLFYAGVVDGGLARHDRFAGHNDYVLNADLGKLGVQEGLFVKLRAEHRYGQSLAGDTGALLPSYVLADLPTSDSENVYLTNVLFTQMFSEQFGVFAGKLDTLDGDRNAFAHGRGKTQFSNIAFVASPILLRSVPYSTLGAGFFLLGEEGTPLFTFSVLNPTDTAKVAGIDELFADGVTLNAELRLPTTFFDKPGHQLIGGTWSSKEYVALGQDPRIVLPNVPIASQDGSWAVYWNFDQYVYVDPCNPARGWGVFGRAGFADGDTNPIEWFLSFGIGGNSPICGRENDTFGAGWYYSGTSRELGSVLELALGEIDDGQGVELFYNIEVTPAFHLTPGVQVIMPARDEVDTATVVGLRAQLIF